MKYIMSQIFSLASSINGNSFIIDQETGMLHANQLIGFTLAKKKKFIEIAPKYWPDVTLICTFVGISKSAYKIHYMHDKVFREKMDSLNEAITDKIEAAMAQFATEKGNFMDRIAWLRAHRGDKYNEKKMIQVDVSMTKDRIESKKTDLSTAIDAELVDADIAKTITPTTVEKPM